MEAPNVENQSNFESPFSYLLFPKAADVNTIRKEIKEAIGEDDLPKCFRILNDKIRNDVGVKNQVISLLGRYNSEERSYRLGVVAQEEYNKTHSQVVEAILNLTENLSAEELTTNQILNTILFPKEEIKFDEQLVKASNPMPVFLIGDEKLKARFFEIYKEIGSPSLRFVEEVEEDVEYGLELNEKTLSIRHIEEEKLIHGIEGFNPATVEYIKTKLEAIEKWKRIGNLSSPESIFEDQVEFVFFEEDSSGEFHKRREIEITLLYPGATGFAAKGPSSKASPSSGKEPHVIWYQLKARNNSNQPFYFSLLHLSANFGVNIYFQCREIPPGLLDWITLDDQHGLLIEDPEADSVTDHFLLIASTHYFEDDHLNEKGMELNQIIDLPKERGIATRGSYQIRETAEGQEWFVKKITVTLRRDGFEQKRGSKRKA